MIIEKQLIKIIVQLLQIIVIQGNIHIVNLIIINKIKKLKNLQKIAHKEIF